MSRADGTSSPRSSVEQEFSINWRYLRPQVVISIQHQEPNDSEKSTRSLSAVLGCRED